MKTIRDKYIIETYKFMTPLGERIRGIKVYAMLENGDKGKMIEQHIFENEEIPMNSKVFTEMSWDSFCKAYKNAAYSFNSTIP